MPNSIRFWGTTSTRFHRVLLSTFVLPFYPWLHTLYPLFTDLQQTNPNHFYYTLLKRVYHCLYWNDLFFAFAYDERSLEDLFDAFWTKYLKRLAKSLDDYRLLVQSCLTVNRSEWQKGKRSIRALYRIILGFSLEIVSLSIFFIIICYYMSINKLIFHESLENKSEYQQNRTKYQFLQMNLNFPLKKNK